MERGGVGVCVCGRGVVGGRGSGLEREREIDT